jgi:hypothetical protein
MTELLDYHFKEDTFSNLLIFESGNGKYLPIRVLIDFLLFFFIQHHSFLLFSILSDIDWYSQNFNS